MRRLVLIALSAAAVALLAADCGGSSKATLGPAPVPSPTISATTTTAHAPSPDRAPVVATPKPARIYKKSELARLALQPKDAPADLRYSGAESGPQTLSSIGLVLPSQRKPAQRFGVKALRDAVFVSRLLARDRRVAERIWLFRTPKGASGWLAQSERDAVNLQFTAIPAPKLGDESWAAQGFIQVGGGVVVTHAFRLGNAVFVVTTYGERTPVSKADALAAAKAALTRAHHV
jgi:hypothetical protein